MLNKAGIRELAYLVRIDKIEPIIGSDNCEAAYVGGWHIMVRKGTFKAGDIAIYFEIDSHVDTTREVFAFLEKKHGNIKTQKYTFGGKGNFISQGLLMAPSDFGWQLNTTGDGVFDPMSDHDTYWLDDEHRFLTQALGVTYASAEDNSRKAPSADKYKKMAQRHPNIFKRRWARWLMKRTWGKKLLFVFFGRKRDKKNGWPSWVVKTDEERIQNCGWFLNDREKKWWATEKVDGTSTTFTMRGYGRKREFYVCSRNVVFDKPNKKCFYETNVYTEMAEKYDIEKILANVLDASNKELDYITIQAETYGEGIQKRTYNVPGHDMAIFNVIFGYKGKGAKRLNPLEGLNWANEHNLPYVPVLEAITLPATCEEVLAYAESEPSQLDGGMREGVVFRSEDGVNSFKAVSNEYLLKYHG